jgi:hypothetical protein
MALSHINDLLRQLAHRVGHAPFSLDDTGARILHIDQITVYVEYLAAENGLRLFSPIGEHDMTPEITGLLLHANVLFAGTRGATIGVPWASRLVTLQKVLPADIDYPNFERCLNDFVATAIDWRAKLEAPTRPRETAAWEHSAEAIEA